MYRHLRSTFSWKKCEAICVWHDHLLPGRGGLRKTPWMGEIHFHRKYLNPAVVAHEAFHAAIDWARRMKLDPTAFPCGEATTNETDHNERVATALERIVGQTLVRMLQRKVFDAN
jgi:hypothetical protein